MLFFKRKSSKEMFKIWNKYQMLRAWFVCRNNSGEASIKSVINTLTIIPINYIFFKNNEEKYAVQLGMLNTLREEKLLTQK